MRRTSTGSVLKSHSTSARESVAIAMNPSHTILHFSYLPLHPPIPVRLPALPPRPPTPIPPDVITCSTTRQLQPLHITLMHNNAININVLTDI
jgi:hypothetical protein